MGKVTTKFTRRILRSQVVQSFATLALVTCLSCHSGWAADPIRYLGYPIAWPATPINYVVSESSILKDYPGTYAAISRAVSRWDSTQSGVRFLEILDPNYRARSDWWAEDLHAIVFDQDFSSGFFVPGVGPVAVTTLRLPRAHVLQPVNGRAPIISADVIVNSGDIAYSAHSERTSYNIEQVVQHELGHFLGSTHDPLGHSSLYPWGGLADEKGRSIRSEDLRGIQGLYPLAQGSSHLGEIVGSVTLNNTQGGPTSTRALALIAIRYELSSPSIEMFSTFPIGHGQFLFENMPPGEYYIYAEPTDRPYLSGHSLPSLTGTTDFESGWLNEPGIDPPIVVQAGLRTSTPYRLLSRVLRYTPTPMRIDRKVGTDKAIYEAQQGETLTIAVLSSNLALNSVELSIFPDVGVSYVNSTQRTAHDTIERTISVAVNASPGPRVIVARQTRNGKSEVAFLSGAIEILPPKPNIDSFQLESTSSSNLTAVRVYGQNFDPIPLAFVGDEMVSVQGVSSTELLVTPRLPIKPGAILLLSRALDGYGDSVQLLPPELLSGQTFKGELPDNNDIDQFTLTVLRESQLNLTLEYDWQSGFRPHLALLGPSGEFALSSFPGQYFQSQYVRSRNGGRKIEIRDFPLSLSGRWTVMVGMPIPGVGGDYQTQLEIAAPAYSELRFRASNALQVASSGTAIAFEALKDSRLNGVLQIRRAPGARINVDSLMGPHGDIAPSLRTSGALSQSIDGRTITFNDARISRIGLYELTLTSSANAGQVVEVRGDLSIGVPQGSGEIRDFDE